MENEYQKEKERPIENQTSFFVPFWSNDYSLLCSSLKESGLWKPVTDRQNQPAYFFDYAKKIIATQDTFCALIYKGTDLSDVYLFQGYDGLKHNFRINEVRCNLFGTGACFLEFRVKYGDADLETITQFAYHFKKAKKPDYTKEIDKGGLISLYDFSKRILPEFVSETVFFTTSAELKYECLCYHIIKVQKDAYSEEALENLFRKLQWTYGKYFNMDSEALNGEYDFSYKAYPQDWWAGSQESLVNVSIEVGNETDDWFIKKYKYIQLVRDYRMLYMILLNQRYSALYYINQSAENSEQSLEYFQLLGHRITKLKTTYSFRLISDDRNYQNLYAELFRILKIDWLLQDLEENKERLLLLRGEETEKADRKINVILVVIAILSLASVLIDASDYLDRWGINKTVSTIISLVITVLVLVVVLLLFRKKK